MHWQSWEKGPEPPRTPLFEDIERPHGSLAASGCPWRRKNNPTRDLPSSSERIGSITSGFGCIDTRTAGSRMACSEVPISSRGSGPGSVTLWRWVMPRWRARHAVEVVWISGLEKSKQGC